MSEPTETGVTVDPRELEALRRANQVLMSLNGNPQARAHLEESLKVVFPQVKTEREVAKELVEPQLAAFEEKLKPVLEKIESIAADRDAAVQAQTEQSLEAAFANMRKTRGFTDDGIAAVKQLMVDNNIADPEAAAARFLELNPPQPQEAPAWVPQHWNMQDTTGGDENSLKALFADEDRWADQMAGTALKEHRERVNSIGVG